MRDPFGEPPGVDEDQCRSMLPDKFCDSIVYVRPDGIRRNRAQFVLRHLDSQIQFSAMTYVDDAAEGWD